jgi:hypothetical protein
MAKGQKSKTYGLAKKKAWRWFARWAKMRDCVKPSRRIEPWGPCFTCNVPTSFLGGHAGHFISGRTNAVLFSENGVHLQCRACNIGYDGKQPTYTLKMIEKYGQAETDRQIALRHKIVKFTQDDLEEIATKYKAKYEALKD